MNTIVFGFRHVHPFCPPLRAPTNAPRPPLGESATAGNRGRKRAQQLPTTAHKRANAENTAENIAETVISSSDTTGLLSTISHQSTQPVQEKSIQQVNAENTTEKPSGNKATIVKNTAQLSKIPRHISHPLSHPLSQPSTQSATQLATQSDTLQEEEQEEELQQANAENTAEKPSGNKATIVKNTAQLSKIPRHISHPLKEEQEEELQQANAENTAEKPSGNKATIVKNTAQLSKIPRHMLSTVPHQIITQQAENTTAT
ncbi:hypothetical protein HO173_011584 [Letharia columbiana]|uniref:Uncharacterized protein n=1 Tax=Letharia columbiana TaxID=112416 RepID=A0A8H6KZ26_9LECA|nr:uncharacterized protein HO173_011584 [Letharia columbiana]KAF6229457.1 hypothetical protein HO173_011584 [Letharia columbiana]